MPVIIPTGLPAQDILREENILVMDADRAKQQDIRPLNIALVNLMPTKIATETQFTRLLSGSPIQIHLDLIYTSSYTPKNVSLQHIRHFYKGIDQVKDKKYDAVIVTGAPVETLPFEDVDYWEEMEQILAFTSTNATTAIYICWGAQAALHYFYGIDKYPLARKLFGVFPHRITYYNHHLFHGFDDIFYAPHSRHTHIRKEDIEAIDDIDILAYSEEAGVHIAATKDTSKIFMMGHGEYDRHTLDDEYQRDVKQGKEIDIPKNYYKDDDPSKEPVVRWRAHANLLFKNIINTVYQNTPFDIREIKKTDK